MSKSSEYEIWSIDKKDLVHFIRNTGSRNQFIMPGVYLVKDQDYDHFIVDATRIDPSKFTFADATSSLYVTRLNLLCYANGPWETQLDEKFKRNISHILKNKHSLMLAKEKEDPLAQTYTHVLPVSGRVWKKYQEGGYKDNSFLGQYILSDQPGAENVHGLILFSVGSLKYQKLGQRRKKVNRQLLGTLIEEAIAWHLKVHMDAYFEKGATVPVMLQNESDIYSHFLGKAAKTIANKSGDGATILEFEIVNH